MLSSSPWNDLFALMQLVNFLKKTNKQTTKQTTKQTNKQTNNILNVSDLFNVWSKLTLLTFKKNTFEDMYLS